MKNVVNMTVLTGLVLLLSGCTDTPSTEKAYAYDFDKRHLAQYHDEKYYYRPYHTWSHVLDANTANLNSVASSGLLECKENDIWFISLNARAEEGKVRYRYFISLAKSQLMKMKDEATFIPRRDSKEFHDLMVIDTQMVKDGLIGCSSQLSQDKLSKLRLGQANN